MVGLKLAACARLPAAVPALFLHLSAGQVSNRKMYCGLSVRDLGVECPVEDLRPATLPI